MRLPKKSMTGAQIERYALLLKLPYFRGVYVLNSLPRGRPLDHEQAVVNLDGGGGGGTHWVAYCKNNNDIRYFDSFGNLRPPQKLLKYWRWRAGGLIKIRYNYKRFQTFRSEHCGALCLRFLQRCRLCLHSADGAQNLKRFSFPM